MKKRDDIYLREIETRIEKINSHLKKLTAAKFQKSDLHRSAVVRELEVIGEAAGKISPETRESLKDIPWNQMIGMRNRLIHGYFDVDYSIVWEVAKNELPKLINPIREAILLTAPPIHPWRICPAGYYHVRKHPRKVDLSLNHPTGLTSVRQHCRHNPSGRDQLYPKEIEEILETAKGSAGSVASIGLLHAPRSANNFDWEIQAWTSYWNSIFEPSTPLDPNIVKALLGSESTFNVSVINKKVRKGNFARGLFQITDETRKILSDEKGELRDHYITLSATDVKNPAAGAAACIRWLFHKRDLASGFLKRPATWEEAVADYKGYLRKKNIGDPLKAKGMNTFNAFLDALRGRTS